MIKATWLVAAVLALPPVGAAPQADPMTWQPCAENTAVGCGTVSVPVDWSRPDGARFDVAVARRPAADPSGVLVYLPAGPGSSGVDAVTNDQIFDLLFPPAIAERFDIVSFDPRGVRRSNPVQCDPALVARLDRPAPTNQREFTELLAAQADLGADCRRRTGPVFDHLASTDVARDVDSIRDALGAEKLNLYALSYGTVVGQTYAEAFPGRIRTMVLDAVFDHSVGSDRWAVTGARAAQESFDQFVAWCTAEPACELHGSDIRGRVADLFARAERGQLSDPDNPGRSIDPTALTGRIVAPLTQPNLPAVAHEIARLGGPAGTVAAQSDPSALLPIYLMCADNVKRIASYAHVRALRAVSRMVAPDVRQSAYDIADLCINPPVPASNPQRPVRAPDAPPILVVNSRYDPSTSYQGAQRVAAQLPGAVLLTYDGLGHGAAPRTDCTREHVLRYLTDGTLPAQGTRCPASY